MIQFSGMPRSGSQWLHKVLSHLASDGAVFTLIGAHNHTPANLWKRDPSAAEPLVGIYRDIHDVLVSAYYYAVRLKRITGEPHPWIEPLIRGKSFEDGLLAMIEDPEQKVVRRYLHWFQSWWGKPHVHLLKFEEVTTDRYHLFRVLHGLGVFINESAYSNVMDHYAHAALQKKQPEHYRSDKAGRTWREELPPKVIAELEEVSDFFLARGGYERAYK